jgi:hypothetical protein
MLKGDERIEKSDGLKELKKIENLNEEGLKNIYMKLLKNYLMKTK